MAEAEQRARILEVFGVTEDELAALGEADGYEAARAQAAADRAEFLRYIEATRSVIEDRLLREIVG